MARFSGKVIEAYYGNGKQNVIIVVYESDKGSRGSYALPNLEDHPEYQDLLKEGWGPDRISENTNNRQMSMNQLFNARVQEVAADMIKQNKNIKTKDAGLSWDSILEKNEDKDEIFNFKMWALETDLVKNAPADLKKRVRKARTILEGMSILNNCM